MPFVLLGETRVQARVGGRYGCVLSSNVILTLNILPEVNELPGYRE